jgi:hypothetical protein
MYLLIIFVGLGAIVLCSAVVATVKYERARKAAKDFGEPETGELGFLGSGNVSDYLPQGPDDYPSNHAKRPGTWKTGGWWSR